MSRSSKTRHRQGQWPVNPAWITQQVQRVVVPVGYPDIGWRDEVNRLEREVVTARARQLRLVEQALLAGCTYSEVGRVLGTSRQAAFQRYRHVRAVAEEYCP